MGGMVLPIPVCLPGMYRDNFYVYIYYTEGKFLKLGNVRAEELMAMSIVGMWCFVVWQMGTVFFYHKGGMAGLSEVLEPVYQLHSVIL